MKKNMIYLFMVLFLVFPEVNANMYETVDPIRQIQIDTYDWMTVDNPKGKLKIRFVRNEDKSGDSTNRPKSFFGKLKNVVNMLLDASDNPPFKVEIVRDKGRKN